MSQGLSKLAARVVLRFAGLTKEAGPLRDVTKLRYQAVFLMGAAGSGKGFVGTSRWLKYMPGRGESPTVEKGMFDQALTEQERGQTNLDFQATVDSLKSKGVRIDVSEGNAKIPFALYTYGPDSPSGTKVDPKDWETVLPPKVYAAVLGLTQVVFHAPKAELPSYWRQVDPDLYKQELAGYLDEQPGYVHEMSSLMAKAYFDAAIRTGDPILINGTGRDPGKMLSQFKQCKEAGYNVSLVFVYTDLTANLIRNATRSRKVNPNLVVAQWREIKESFAKLRPLADKAKLIDNNARDRDIKVYEQNKDFINGFIADHTSWDSLYDLIAEVRPQELQDWGKAIR